MNSLTVAVFVVVVAAASASGLWGLGHGGVIAGPSGAIIAGPIAGHGLGHAGIINAGLGHGGIVGHAGVLGLGNAGILGLGNAGLLGLGHAGLVVPAGHGLEGQWVPDINEHLYDDGSYKPHVYGH